MLTTPRAQIVEKLITSPEGVVFLATFLVFEEMGKVKARLVKAVPVQKAEKTDEVLAICGDVSKCFVEILKEVFSPDQIVSPYNSILYFTGAKPRAPTFA